MQESFILISDESMKEKPKEKEKWLSDELGARLKEIRKLVTELYELKERIPQVKWFTPHGESHCEAVESILHQLIPIEKCLKELTENERFFLLASAWLHDIGMLKGIFGDDDDAEKDDKIRDEHHIRSEKYLISNYREVGVRESEKEAFGILARFHRRRCPLSDCSEDVSIPGHNRLRLKLLAAYLRLADALHIDQSRTPDVQYAISLTYDIPYKSKLHWLRSRFVLGLSIESGKKEIVIHLKHPLDIDLEKIENQETMRRTLADIYDLIVQDLDAELNTVKDVLFAYNISYFLTIKKEVHKVQFDKRWLRDITSVFGYYNLLDNPSSSSLYTLLLQAISEIIESYKCNEASDPAFREVRNFLDEIDKEVLHSRKCHTGLRNFVEEIRRKVEEGDINDLKTFIHYRIWQVKQKRKGIRFSAYRYFQIKLEKAEQSDCNFLIDMESKNKKFNILLYGYSELVINCLCGFRDGIIKFLINNYNKKITQTNNCSDTLFGKTGNNTSGMALKEIEIKNEKIIKSLEKFINGDKVEKKLKKILIGEVGLPKKLEDILDEDIIQNILDIVLNKLESGNDLKDFIDGTLIVTNLKNLGDSNVIANISNTIRIDQKLKEMLKEYLSEEEANMDLTKDMDDILYWFLNQDKTRDIIKKILYGDKIRRIYKKIDEEKDPNKKRELEKRYCNRLPLFHDENLEKKASEYFRIFICEGQPKNRTTWGGRTLYHDGSQYALSLASRGFSNLFIIPDATATSLILPYYQLSSFPKIDYVMVGTNGYDDKMFLHSAGHAMVSVITSFSRHLSGSDYLNDIECKIPPTLILALMTDKYKLFSDKDKEGENEKQSNSSNKKDDEPKSVDGWLFQNSFAKEPVRSHLFISQDQELRKKLSPEKIRFYNPREDKIPIRIVDVVITEKAWIDKELEGKLDGNLITNKNNDSSRNGSSTRSA